ncbi:MULTISPECIES: filamentous hemagglutinin N-terminal domain-containing protein [unclassified Leptolyngbya]|uniref:two-partner secretion domain-containing protein n=1 Tax=unclassified Leptolyngbya TaxID=2650499 RepID=UPI001685094D|nr:MULTISPECIES: filamentous hemagglutinin N-terminal domain-containing protein [unclassified Leptolyngbya]MBD1913067.1 filamentous hemagglutinin N-terminal domain-containing protein [Leptolyngbya sp. FACHB-8]MBD2154432.1 filamentous hemagglutinin N-terminal domain-containing protein [Leptolyngbya sp. FACHB-16]
MLRALTPACIAALTLTSLVGAFDSVVPLSMTPSALAQPVIPDTTLGNESSTVIPLQPGNVQIGGGAQRGSNLFHSFRDFNVLEGGSVYFQNPAGIENILGRVTGEDASRIFGTLGVLGDANLFLLNPNGFIFGENARLDVRGSFLASTANQFTFANGNTFSAVNPAAPPLLNLNITPGLQYGANATSGDIVNRGRLYAPGDFTLAANNLNLQGQLWSGGNLTLRARDTLQIRDRPAAPFVAAAQGRMVLQGNQQVDIFALGHTDSGFWAGGDIRLRSANRVGGDAHYYSGGNFRVEQLDGSLGTLYSPYDPVVRSLGNVSFDSYIGNSLHILAAGSVNVPNFIQILNQAAPGEAVLIEPNLRLSNGAAFPINGLTEPTLDIRAGVDPDVVGIEANSAPGNFFNLAVTPPPITRANINVGTIILGTVASANLPPDFLQGRILLTNRYAPDLTNFVPGNIRIADTQVDLPNNPDLNGAAIRAETPDGGGFIAIDSRGNINIAGRINANAVPTGTDANGNATYAADGGNVTLLANGNITFEAGSGQFRTGVNSVGALGGDITLRALGNITLRGNSFIDSTSANSDRPTAFNTIRIESVNGSVRLNRAGISAMNTGTGFAGDIFVDARRQLDLRNESRIAADGNSGRIFLGSTSTRLNSDRTAPNRILLDNSTLSTTNSIINGARDAGDITVRGRNVFLQNESFLSADTSGFPAGTEAIGNGGNINILSQNLQLTGGSEVLTQTFGAGNSGNIFVGPINPLAPSFVLISDVAPLSFEVVDQPDGTQEVVPTGGFSSGFFSTTETSVQDDGTLVVATGNGGNIRVRAGVLRLQNGGVISARTRSLGDSQNIDIRVGRLNIRNGAQILSASLFTDPNGNAGDSVSSAGNIIIRATDEVLISGYDRAYNSRFTNLRNAFNSVTQNPVTAFQRTQQTIDPISPYSGLHATDLYGFGEAGRITVISPTTTLSNLASIDATTRGNLDGGNITLRTQDLQITGGATITSATTGGFRNPQNNGGTVTYTPSTGNAGNIIILPLDPNQPSSISILGVAPAVLPDVDANGNPVVTPGGFSSGLLATTERFFLDQNTIITTEGDGGRIRLGTAQNPFTSIRLEDGAVVGSRSRSLGDAGDVVVHTGDLSLTGGSQMVSSTFGYGNAGSVRIYAAGQVQISGADEQFGARSVAVTQAIQDQAIAQGITLTPEQILDNSRGFITQTQASRTEGIAPSGIQSLAAFEQTASDLDDPLSGNIRVEADAIFLGDRAEINSESRNSDRTAFSSVTLSARSGPVVLDNSLVSTTNFGTQYAGDIFIASPTDIRIENRSNIFSIGNFGRIFVGNGLINPNDIHISGGSQIRTDNQNAEGFGFSGGQQAGRISFRANDDIEVEDRLTQISSATFNQADAGAIFFLAGDDVVIQDGATVFTTVEQGAQGSGGRIDVETNDFSLLNGSQLQTQVNRNARGNAGAILIQAQDDVLMDNSAMFTSIAPGAIGAGGVIAIGDALFSGDNLVGVNPADSVVLRNGAQLIANTEGVTENSNAGDVLIVANQITLDGVNEQGFPSALFSGVGLGGQGSGGDVLLSGAITRTNNGYDFQPADRITISDGALVTVSSYGFSRGRIVGLARNDQQQQRAGNIGISTRFLDLDNGRDSLNTERGIYAETGVGGGGNITVNADGLVVLRGATRISTTAGRFVQPGDGGNIIVNATEDGFILAEPYGNNDITADSVVREGGRVELTADQVFGLFFRTREELLDELNPDNPLDPDRLPTSDVTAISQTDASLDGDVVLNADRVDPARGLIELPAGVVDATDQVGQVCPRGPRAAERLGRFVITGRGGVSSSPIGVMDDAGILTDWLEDGNTSPVESSTAQEGVTAPTEQMSLVEADSWAIAPGGQIRLVANTPHNPPVGDEHQGSCL